MRELNLASVLKIGVGIFILYMITLNVVYKLLVEIMRESGFELRSVFLHFSRSCFLATWIPDEGI